VVLGEDGKPIPVYTTVDGNGEILLNPPFAKQEFPSLPVSHGFTDIVDNYAGEASQFKLGDGATLYQLDGSLNGVSGRFEWIVDPKLGGVSHRMFVPRGTINGAATKP
jgi:filamentous hemagglutinin